MSATRRGVLGALMTAPLFGCDALSLDAGTIHVGLNAGVTRPAVPVARPEFGCAAHVLDDDEGFDAARAAGFSFLRTDLFWLRIEDSAGRFDYSAYDAYVDRLRGHGLGLLAILDYQNPRYGDGDFRRVSERAAFLNYVSRTVARYRGHGLAYEIWNEPDVEENAYIAPRYFAQLVRETCVAIRAAEPTALIASGGASWVDLAYLNEVLAHWRGNPPALNAFAQHFYRGDAPESALRDIAVVRARVASSFGRPLPVWNTEWGYSSLHPPGTQSGRGGHDPVYRARQAVLLPRQFFTLWQGGVERSVWYVIRDSGTNPQSDYDNLGLLDMSGVRKPAYHAAETFARQTAGRRLVGELRDLPNGLRALRLDGGQDVVFAVWSERPGQHTRVAVAGGRVIGAVDVLGNPLDPSRLALTEMEGPIYLSVRS